MATLPAPDSLVQSLVDALSPVLTPLLRALPLLDLMRGEDRVVRDVLLQAARRVAEQAFSQPQRPAQAAYRKACRLHTALGPLVLVLWGRWGDAGQLLDPIPAALWAHGCTATVRE